MFLSFNRKHLIFFRNWSLNTANNSLDQSSDKKSNNKLKKNSEESGANTKMNSGQQQESPDGNLLANRFELAGEAAPGTDPQAKQHLNENEFEGNQNVIFVTSNNGNQTLLYQFYTTIGLTKILEEPSVHLHKIIL